jgi:hypothetical protein
VAWDTTTTVAVGTTTASNTSHALTALASDAAGNSTTSAGVAVTVNNPVVLTVISQVAASSITYSGATITWATDKPPDSQVAYGLTTAYGSLSPLVSTLTTSHTINLNELAASTTYHYQVLSHEAQGNLAVSGDFTFTTSAAPSGPPPALLLHADATELNGTGNGGVVTSAIGPAGFSGQVAINGTGSVNFSPAQTGNGVYFLNCCARTNNAYYAFGGTTLGSIFNVSQGQITFYLKSRYSFAQRQASAASPRYTFD